MVAWYEACDAAWHDAWYDQQGGATWHDVWRRRMLARRVPPLPALQFAFGLPLQPLLLLSLGQAVPPCLAGVETRRVRMRSPKRLPHTLLHLPQALQDETTQF